jgi:hypothetical protein
MNITISNVKNANELDAFIPVEGWWFAADEPDRNDDSIQQAVRNYMDASYNIGVQLFTAEGHAILGDLPSAGTFLATRK